MLKTILVVDDRMLNRKMLALLLGHAGYRVLESGDGEQALAMVRQEQPALVISDVLMPIMDGIEFANRLHADPAIAHIPVIFYTATYRVNEARVMAQTCGVAAVLGKPSEPQLILDAVAMALGVDPTPIAKREFPDLQTTPSLPELAGLQRRLQQAMMADIDAGAPSGLGGGAMYALGNVHTLSLRLAALVELGMTLSSERDPARLLELFCRASQDIMNARYAAVGMYANGQPRRFACCGMTAVEIEAIFEALDPDPGSARDAGAHPGVQQFSPQHPFRRTFLIVRVMLGSHQRGWLYLAEKFSVGDFNAEDQEFAATLGAQLAPAYENLSLYEEVRQHAGRLELEVLERKRIAEQLLESEAKLRQLAETDGASKRK